MKRSRLLAAGLVLVLGACVEARADDEAKALLECVAETYRSRPSYADDGRFLLKQTIDGKPRTLEQRASVAFERPGKIDIELGPWRVTSDGKTLTAVAGPLRQFAKSPAPAAFNRDAIIDQPIAAFTLGDPLGPPVDLILRLLTEPDLAKALRDESVSDLKIEPDATIDGASWKELVLERGKRPALRLSIDPMTQLIGRVEVRFDAEQAKAAAPPGRTWTEVSALWVAGPIRDPAPGDRFTAQPPADFREVAALGVEPKAAEAEKPPEPKKP